MKIIKILSLFCFLTLAIYAQQNTTVSGRLTGEGQTVANRTIRIVSATQTYETTTDENGNYRFENVPDGNYLLVYNNKQASVTVKNGEVSIANLAEVVVISANSTQTIDEVSKTVNIIDAQELRDRADFSLAETLRTIPGFRVQQLGGFGRTASVKTRGLRNQDTAVLIDGIRFRDAASITGDASAFLSDFTLTSVSRIEVLRGSGSSLYGTNAIGGAIDFQTPKPQTGWHGQIGGAFGGYGLGRFRGNLSNGTKDGKLGFNLGVSRTVYAKGIDGEDDAHNTNFQSRIEYNPFSKTNISGRFFISDAYVRLNSSPDTIGTQPTSAASTIDAVPLSREELRRYETGTPISQLKRGNANFIPDANDPDNFQKSKFFNGQLFLTQIFNGKLVFQGFYQGLKTSRKNTDGVLGIGFQPFGGSQTYFFDGQIHTASGILNWTAFSNNQVKIGYEYEWEKFGNDGAFVNAANNFSTRARQSSNTFYVQDLLSFFDDKLQFSGAFRAQWFALETPDFSSTNFPNRFRNVSSPPASYTGDGSASYYFKKTGTKIRAHVGNGYRVPSLYERFGSYYFFSTFFGLGNPDLKPERSIAFDGGIEQALYNNRAKFTAVYFYTEIKDEISYLPTDALGEAAYFNYDKHFSRGAEFGVKVGLTSSTDIFASYTFTNSDVRNSRRLTFLPPATVVSQDRKSFGVPDHQFTLVATQRFKRAWVNFDFLATSDYLAQIFSNQTFQSYTYRFKGNRRADLTAGYTFPMKNEKLNLRVFGTIENLFDNDYYENGFRTYGRNGRIGLSFGF